MQCPNDGHRYSHGMGQPNLPNQTPVSALSIKNMIIFNFFSKELLNAAYIREKTCKTEKKKLFQKRKRKHVRNRFSIFLLQFRRKSEPIPFGYENAIRFEL